MYQNLIINILDNVCLYQRTVAYVCKQSSCWLQRACDSQRVGATERKKGRQKRDTGRLKPPLCSEVFFASRFFTWMFYLRLTPEVCSQDQSAVERKFEILQPTYTKTGLFSNVGDVFVFSSSTFKIKDICIFMGSGFVNEGEEVDVIFKSLLWYNINLYLKMSGGAR